jgi:formylglycine-generating enzyme required for sulfatase activity
MRPITYVNYYQILAFINWLNSEHYSNKKEYYIPTYEEWYKAGFYNPSLNKFYIYATQSDEVPGNIIGDDKNQINYIVGVNYSITQNSILDPNQNYLTDCGTYINSPSYYGTYDQNGLVFELVKQDNKYVYKGGFWASGAITLLDTTYSQIFMEYKGSDMGFRIVQRYHN